MSNGVQVVGRNAEGKLERMTLEEAQALEVEAEEADEEKKAKPSPIPARPKIEKPDWKKMLGAELAQCDEVLLRKRKVKEELDRQRGFLAGSDARWEEVVRDAAEARKNLKPAREELKKAENALVSALRHKEEVEGKIQAMEAALDLEPDRLRTIAGEIDRLMGWLTYFLKENC